MQTVENEKIQPRKSPEQTLMEDMVPEIRPKPEADKAEKDRLEMERVKSHVVDCINAGIEYREKFIPTWQEIENQIRQVEPPEWSLKEPWQTKVYIGLQAKTSETAFANLNAMTFPSDRFFEITGTERRDREVEGALQDLMQNLFSRGGFYNEKDFILEEAGDIGTSWCKLIAKADKSGIDYVWRSAYDCLVDGSARHNWKQSKFWVDQYQRDISYIMEEIRKGQMRTFYNTDLLKESLKNIEAAATGLQDKDIVQVRNIDGTGDLKIPKDYKTVTLNEFWGLMPMPNDPNDESQGYTLKWVVVTMLNKEHVIRIDDNPYGFIPAWPCKVKPMKYEAYGKGYLINGRGTQDLMNSMICLGFDSMKLNSMDIIIIDENAIADQSSIQYKPTATWKVKGDPRAAVLMTRHGGVSAMSDILNGIALLDRTHQDVTGVTRHSEGSPTIDGKQGEQTLGEYQLKLQAVDRRFLSVAKRIEEDFIKNILRMTYMIITNPLLFTQEAVDRVLGFKDVTVNDPATGQPVKVIQMPRLYLKSLYGQGDMAFDFRGSGVSQFSERQKTLEKLHEALQEALKNPTLAAMTNIDILWRRLFQVAEIPDWEEILKSPEDMKKVMGFLNAMQSGVPANGAPLDKITPPAGVPTRSAA